jgi:hypothetical protein
MTGHFSRPYRASEKIAQPDAINISQEMIVLSRKMIIIDEMRQFRDEIRLKKERE